MEERLSSDERPVAKNDFRRAFHVSGKKNLESCPTKMRSWRPLVEEGIDLQNNVSSQQLVSSF